MVNELQASYLVMSKHTFYLCLCIYIYIYLESQSPSENGYSRTCFYGVMSHFLRSLEGPGILYISFCCMSSVAMNRSSIFVKASSKVDVCTHAIRIAI